MTNGAAANEEDKCVVVVVVVVVVVGRALGRLPAAVDGRTGGRRAAAGARTLVRLRLLTK
jgi:hypothetical protein